MHRVFVMGFPRSGTTIVQAWLARQLDAFTLPETSFFEHACGNLALRWGDREAGVSVAQGIRWTYAELGAKADAVVRKHLCEAEIEQFHA